MTTINYLTNNFAFKPENTWCPKKFYKKVFFKLKSYLNTKSLCENANGFLKTEIFFGNF